MYILTHAGIHYAAGWLVSDFTKQSKEILISLGFEVAPHASYVLRVRLIWRRGHLYLAAKQMVAILIILGITA